MLRLLILVLCLSLCSRAVGSDSCGYIYNLLHYTTEDGLPSDKIRGIARGSDGILWVTTDKGLSSFDGKFFHSINLSQGSRQFTNDLGQIAIDSADVLWISTYNQGLIRYDRTRPLANAIEQFDVKNARSNLVKNELYAVLVSRTGLVYYGGQETGLQAIDPHTRKVQHISIPGEDPGGSVTIYTLSEDVKGHIWIGTRYDGFFKYDPRTGEIQAFDLRNQVENAVTSVLPLESGVYAAYYDHDLTKWAGPKDTPTTGLLGLGRNRRGYDNFITTLTYFPESRQILAGHVSKGLYLYDVAGHHHLHIPWSEVLEGEAGNIRIYSVLVVKGGYWMATDNGLFYYNNRLSRKHRFLSKGTLPAAHTLFSVNNTIWYQTADNFGELDKGFQPISQYSLSGLRVTQAYYYMGTVYFSTLDKGIYVFDIHLRQLRPLSVKGDAHGMERADCNTVLADTVKGRQILWIGSWNSGLYKYDLLTQRLELYNATNGLPDHKVISLGRDGSGRIWIGMDGFGLLQLLDKTKPVFKQFTHDGSENSPASNLVFAFLPSSSGELWFSNATSGIGKITELAGHTEFRQIRDNNAYPWSYATKMVCDRLGRIWIRNREGVMVFDPLREIFYQLQPGDGILPDKRFAIYDFFTSNTDIIWCTDKGLLITDVDGLSLAPDVSGRPLLTVLKVLNQDRSYQLVADRISLEPYENNLSISFSSPEHLHMNNLRYAYQLEGVDNDWVVSDEDQHAVYTNLSGGQYRFKVRLGDIYGQWSDQYVEKTIWIKIPWYLTLYSKVSLALILFTTVFLFFYYRINQQKKINRLQLNFNQALQHELDLKVREVRQQELSIERERHEKRETEFRRRIYESELKAIRSQMNPHFIFNILNSIEAYIVENDSYTASSLIRKFATLSRIVLENSQFSLAMVKSEVQLVTLYLELEQKRFEHRFDFGVEVDKDVDTDRLMIPSMLIQPIVENAVHHGIRHLLDKKGMVTVRIKKDKSEIHIEILDNGVGLGHPDYTVLSSMKASSFGLKGVRERIEIINREQNTMISRVELQELPGNDFYTTRVLIVLPVYFRPEE